MRMRPVGGVRRAVGDVTWQVQFEWWAAEVMDHSKDSVHANSYPAFWLVDEARANARAFPTAAAETAALIYNYAPVFTGPDGDFEQEYWFT